MKTISFDVILDDATAEALECLKKRTHKDTTEFFMEAVMMYYWDEIKRIKYEMMWGDEK